MLNKNFYNNFKNYPAVYGRFLFLIITALFLTGIFHGYAAAIAPPLNEGKSLPRELMAERSHPGAYGSMISPAASRRGGVSSAIGGGVGMNLTDYIKTNKNVGVIIIMVEFSDVKMSPAGLAGINSMAVEMCRFFGLQSNGKIEISTASSPRVYNLSKPMGYYGNSDDAESLVRDAVAAADGDIDFSKYQCVMVAHAGYGDETNPADGGTQDIWSRYWYSYGYNSINTNDGVKIDGATIVPELEYEGVSPLGVICHEFGHQLGLPDLYDTSYSTEGGLGRWSLMATGAYNGVPRGSRPAILDPWCRKRLGWVEYEKLSGVYTLFNFEFNKVYQIAADRQNPPIDYFLFEKRAAVPGTYDEGLPGEGLLIYHLNATAGNESSLSPNNNKPGLIWLICANAGDHLTATPRSKVRGLNTDPYPTAGNTDFYSHSNPSSKTWAGGDSNVALRNIKKNSSGAALAITADIYAGAQPVQFFSAASFSVPGVDTGIILIVKPQGAITGELTASFSGNPYITGEFKLSESSSGKYYYVPLKLSSKPGRLELTLKGVKKENQQAIAEQHILYY
jgi:M6 family metalloprotease-like protein